MYNESVNDSIDKKDFFRTLKRTHLSDSSPEFLDTDFTVPLNTLLKLFCCCCWLNANLPIIPLINSKFNSFLLCPLFRMSPLLPFGYLSFRTPEPYESCNNIVTQKCLNSTQYHLLTSTVFSTYPLVWPFIPLLC